MTALQDIKPMMLEPTGETHFVAPVDRMLEAALNSDVPLDRLERLMDMKRDHEDSEKQKQFNTAMAMCQRDMPTVIARNRNTQTNSNFATLANIYAVAKPVSTGYGLSFSVFPQPCDQQDMLAYKWTLRHAGGYSESDIALVPKDAMGIKGNRNKTETHAFGSSTSYARRYLFTMIFDIAVGQDDDGNTAGGNRVETISDTQYIAIRDKAGELGIDESVICNAEKVNALQELPASLFDRVMRELKTTEEKQNAARNRGTIMADLGEVK